MLFNSAPFLFVFLPVVWLGHVLIARRWPTAGAPFLLLASLAFYAAWDLTALPLLLASLGGNFLAGRWLGYPHRHRRLGLGLFIFANLALLGYFKYANFAVRVWGDVSGSELAWTSVVLPIGISFFTFQQIAYLVDSYREQRQEPAFSRYALFVTFFPHLIAGPMVHHREMIPQFGQPRLSRLRDVGEGVTLLTLGLLKKLVIADSVAVGSSAVFDAAARGHVPTLLEAWLAAFAYALQIYFDFSAYSDMAIGLGRMFGIDLPINFASPYKARSVAEFWRRWHITLSRFLRDYLYIPLGGNRQGPLRQKVNLMLTMALGGLWHGAEWTFLTWGALHGLYLIINHLWRASSWSQPFGATRLGGVLAHALTLLCVVVAWVPFRAVDMHTSLLVWGGMLGRYGVLSHQALPGAALADSAAAPILGFDGPSIFWLCVFLAMALKAPNAYQILTSARLGLSSRGYADPALQPAPASLTWRPSLGFGLLMGVAFGVILLELNDASEFIYFQF